MQTGAAGEGGVGARCIPPPPGLGGGRQDVSRVAMVYLKMVYSVFEKMKLYGRCLVDPWFAVCSPLAFE